MIIFHQCLTRRKKAKREAAHLTRVNFYFYSPPGGDNSANIAEKMEYLEARILDLTEKSNRL